MNITPNFVMITIFVQLTIETSCITFGTLKSSYLYTDLIGD